MPDAVAILMLLFFLLLTAVVVNALNKVQCCPVFNQIHD